MSFSWISESNGKLVVDDLYLHDFDSDRKSEVEADDKNFQ